MNTLRSVVGRYFSKPSLIIMLLIAILPVGVAGAGFSVSVLPTRISLPEQNEAASRREADGLRTTVGQMSVLPEQRQAVSTALGRVFTPEVQRWAPAISEWAQQYAIDADIIGTLMQLESCGDSQAVSSVGAQGLFQVMPFHFQASEDRTDPDTNARRGLEYLKETLKLANGNVGLGLVGYNQGLGTVGKPFNTWLKDTQWDYIWGTGIYWDAVNNLTPEQSLTLQDWLKAGGSVLCQRAAQDPRFAATPPPAISTTESH